MTAPDVFKLKLFFEEELAKRVLHPLREGEFSSKRLKRALVYATESPGKRLRPLLTLSMALAERACSPGLTIKRALPGALAVEYIHTYSLIHDDLPAMDNDDFRRGRLSVHRRFDEGLAILAGDALLADAFYLVSTAKCNAALMCRELSLTTGSCGLAAGQSEDLDFDNVAKDASFWFKINALKTARLFEASAVMGMLAVNAPKEKIALARHFGQIVGEAFQMKDDLDDRQGLARKETPAALSSMLRERIMQAQKISEQFSYQSPVSELLHLAFATAV